MQTEVAAKPRDCLACRLVGSAGLVGIGGYLGSVAWKNKTFAGRYTISTLSFGKNLLCFIQDVFCVILSCISIK